MSLDPSEIAFDEFIEKKKTAGRSRTPYPSLVVGSENWKTLYLSANARELMDIDDSDNVIAAPDPEARDNDAFYICKCDDSGYAISIHGGSARTSKSVVHNLGDEFQQRCRYELLETEMQHPEWGTDIYYAIPVSQEEHESRLEDAK